MAELDEDDAHDDRDQAEGEPQVDVLVAFDEADDRAGEWGEGEGESERDAEVLGKTE
jgi:hypothetical protein